MLTQRWIWEFDVPRERLWTYLADTDWVNEHAGLPRIAVEFEPLPEGGTRKYGSFRQGPFLVRWEERPTIWQVPEFFTVERIYSHGPLRRFFNTTSFERLADDRTRVVVDLRLEAASPLIEPLLPMLAAHGKRGADRAFTSGASLARADGAPRAQASTSESVFTPLRDAGIDSRIVTTIAAFVEGAEDRDVQRMRPYELADRWRLPRREVLRAFLTATRVGLLNLRWSVLCPGCRGPSPGAQSLSDVAPDYHCPSCNLAFGPAFDRSVEVTFDARPLGRGGVEGVFCLASPQRSAHVHAQCAPAAGETTLLDLE
ncbi:MAG TPA: DUF5939 domain-containing protein, partial [Candidatus Baltobacteraceae bacterium]|nr:DUF5939 domain-containing protein [Candidatus Baltobacteraceae bacterium]